MSSSDEDGNVRHRSRSRKTKDLVRGRVHEAAAIGQEAVASGAYTYPFRGIYYLVTHPNLAKPLQKPLLTAFLASIGVTVVLFLFTYFPQALALSLFSGPLGFVAAIPLVFGEATAIVTFLSKAFWIGPALEDIFDEVLLRKGHTDLVSKGRAIETNSHGRGKTIGKLLTRPLNRFHKENIIRYLISLPLNAIPAVGTVVFLFYNGNKSGPSYHDRYFQLKRMTPEQRAAHIKAHRGAYTGFGTAALALGLIPGAAIVLSFTTAVGAALWASDMEKNLGAPIDPTVGPGTMLQTSGGEASRKKEL